MKQDDRTTPIQYMPQSPEGGIHIYDECEIHTNCTVEILRNSKTGEMSIGWWENERAD